MDSLPQFPKTMEMVMVGVTKYIRTLPIYVQNVIETLLKDAGMSKKDIELGMSSRLCDLEDVINSEELVRVLKE